jgi:hypothetical protein
MRKVAPFIVILALSLTMGVALAGPPGQDAGGQVYVVQKDDWLSKIAEKYYGDVLAYPAIVEATNAKAAEDDSFAVIANPDVIEVGQQLWIPEQADPRVEDLRNAAYQGIYDEPVQLADGLYEGEPFVPGGASRPTVTFLDPFYAFGDLTGDGVEDAAVTLAENSGGSGTFIYLAAVVDQDGAPQNVATLPLGDRVNLKSLTILDGQIGVTMVSHAPDDPMCCPSVESSVRYRLEDDQLVEQSN